MKQLATGETGTTVADSIAAATAEIGVRLGQHSVDLLSDGASSLASARQLTVDSIVAKSAVVE